MVETIESFVAKLKTEGVEEAQRQATEVLGEAKGQSEDIISKARAQADKIVADAKAEGQNILARGQTELELASRDAALKLCKSLENAMQAILGGPVKKQLDDADFLRDLLRDITMSYVKSDMQEGGCFKINLSPEMHKQLADWAIQMMHEMADKTSETMDMKDTLSQSGFEFNIGGGTVEITQESVVEILMELVGPRLRDIFKKSLAKS